MAESKKNRRVVYDLWKKQNGHCYYCGVKTVKLSPGFNGIIPYNAATLEHLYSKYDIRRFLQKFKRSNTVMACLKCNSDRATRENCMMKWHDLHWGIIDIRTLI